MKNRKMIIIPVLALGTALMLAVSARAQNARTASLVSLSELRSQLTTLQNSVAGTMESLQQVKTAAAGGESGLTKAAADFRSRFNQLESQVGTVRTQAVLVKARAADHYESWQKDLSTVQNAKIREKAQDRFTEAKKEFDKIVEKAGVAKEEALPLVSELKT